ncbi:dihydroorotase [Rhodothalassium salexigens DSM 2132]|uniref:Dihydroorotase n=1 Tax=Rhodothalassium salexigens DSM 2132 TaxID=1188247 RepID=A0A4R2PPV9_RHOSA|nr:dihydroorotase [Rhodothalassium salexigens]MBB4210757.1 dihydroorotase [Rhodothalassium salexigens DSM 2132]MBK1638262.1 hypothetical protein [Rhodothalassium salexigens DSM 2132]TCP37687.1 dihydroorotase [Rhodothalassium salexigens DSM 2132]
MTETLFLNARLIDPASGRNELGALLVRDGRIEAIGDGAKAAATSRADRVDLAGHLLCPGLVDMMAFKAEPAACLAGGITTVALMPDAGRPIDTDAAVEHVTGRRDGVRVLAYGAATRGLAGQEMAEMGLMHAAGAVGFSDGRRAIGDARVMRRVLSYAARFDALVVQHCEDPALANGGVMNEGATATRLGLAGIPAAAETILAEREARLTELSGGRCHLGQVTAAETLDVVRRAKARGVRLTCGVSPHHLTLNETAVGDYRTFAKLSPPLRDEADRAACAAAVADGTVDVIVSVHDPQDEEDKRLPFSEAAPGAVGAEALLALALALYHKGEADLVTVLRCLTSRPAELLGLAAGRLVEGAPADLVVIDLDAPWRIDKTALKGVTKNTPHDGLPVQGRVRRTLVAGETLYQA